MSAGTLRNRWSDFPEHWRYLPADPPRVAYWPGCRFVSLPYGECAREIAEFIVRTSLARNARKQLTTTTRRSGTCVTSITLA
jgi:hypothetical protein